MTNYNEILEEIAVDLWVKYGRPGTMDEFVREAKQAIASLTKEMVAEAKPKDYVDYYANDPIERGRKISYDEAVREFEQNLLKALEEV